MLNNFLNNYNNSPTFANGAGAQGMAGVDASRIIEDLQKALSAGTISGRDTQGLTNASGASLKYENLEAVLKNISFRDNDIVLWRDTPVIETRSTVHEFNRLRDYGAGATFMSEGELPEATDSTYQRDSEVVRLIGTTRSVTDVLSRTNNVVENISQLEIQNGIKEVLALANSTLTTGDNAVNPLAYNGFYTQHFTKGDFASLNDYWRSEVVIDLRGKSLTAENLDDAAQTILDNFGTASTFYAPPRVLGDFAKDIYDRQRVLLGQAGGQGQLYTGAGQPNMTYTSVGAVSLKSDLFLQRRGARAERFRTLSATDRLQTPKSPAAPIAPTVSIAAADPLSQWSGSAGTYQYAVAAMNQYGESPLLLLTTGQAVTATDSVDLGWQEGTGSAYAATGFIVYRSEVNPADGTGATTKFYPVLTVSRTQYIAGTYDGAIAVRTVRDRNRVLPNTEQGFMAQFDNQVLSVAQLAPVTKVNLAQIDLTYRYAIFGYWTPLLYAPRKLVRVVNIGQYVAP